MTATDDDTVEVTLQRRLAQRLHAFSNTVSGTYYQRTGKPFRVALVEWRVLRSAILAPGISQGEVAIDEGLNVMNVSRAVASLRRKGLIEANPDPEDRRRSLLAPTELGRDIGADIGAREEVMYEHLFSVLSVEELVYLDDLMERVNRHVRTAEFPPPPAPSKAWVNLIADASEL